MTQVLFLKALKRPAEPKKLEDDRSDLGQGTPPGPQKDMQRLSDKPTEDTTPPGNERPGTKTPVAPAAKAPNADKAQSKPAEPAMAPKQEGAAEAGMDRPDDAPELKAKPGGDEGGAADPTQQPAGLPPEDENAEVDNDPNGDDLGGGETEFNESNVSVGDHVSFVAGAFSGVGEVTATGDDGCTVADETGREHRVHWEEITGSSEADEEEDAQLDDPPAQAPPTE